ncbi:hypothetical protein VCHC41B1_0323A, partial [Vibrio cholerae HC-41B1]
MAWCEIPPP